jgi:DNA sulfur modification protein DndD
MYLSRLHLQNWRSYADASFDFNEPTERKSVVLVGAMNGHGKTSFLVALYLGLFGRFGLRHCEGFASADSGDITRYRKALAEYRRSTADPVDPTVIDMTLTPTIRDADEEEVRIVRRWYFTGRNEPKPGAAFEQIEIYVGGRLQRASNLDKDPILLAQERIERNLFQAHVAPAFFFDGEQAQKLIENMGSTGIKRAVEVMFGTKIVEELSATLKDYLTRVHQSSGGKKKVTERQSELERKCVERDALDSMIGKKQVELKKLEDDQELKESERAIAQEEQARMGGALGGTRDGILSAHAKAAAEETAAMKALTDSVRSLGLSLAVARMSLPIQNRLKNEQVREDWEGLRKGTLDNKEKVMDIALPEPASDDTLLGFLSPEVRLKVRERFIEALEKIYNPPRPGWVPEYLLGHVKGDARAKVLGQLAQAQTQGSARTKTAAKRLRDAREMVEETKEKVARLETDPGHMQGPEQRIAELTTLIQQDIRKAGALENEIKKLKADHKTLNEEIGRIQEELARLGPEQQRIAVAERVGRALEAILEKLEPVTTRRLEEFVTRHFIAIADRRYRNVKITLPPNRPPELHFPDERENRQLQSNSGFEKRAFGIAYTLALAEITRRRVPLVIDTPLGNADSEYRPRTLKALADFDLDQVIILTHDEEVTARLVEHIRGQVSQKFLVEYRESEKLSVVHPNRYFDR